LEALALPARELVGEDPEDRRGQFGVEGDHTRELTGQREDPLAVRHVWQGAAHQWAACSFMRLPAHEGQSRTLQDNGTTRGPRQRVHSSRTKPWPRSPQAVMARSWRSTKRGSGRWSSSQLRADLFNGNHEARTRQLLAA